jgi:hypothetical protein
MRLFRAAAVSALLALLFAASACGGSDDGDASPSPARSPSPGSSPSPASPGASPSPATSTPAGATQTPSATPTPDIATPVSQAPFVPAEGNYCDTVTPSSPPNSGIGLLKIDGVDAPAGTTVQVAFDGVPGPEAVTREAGGYRVDFGIATSADCANRAGAAISIVIDGVEYETGRVVGSAAAIRFDIGG